MRTIVKYASLLLASAVMLLSCEKTGGENVNMDAGFHIMSDKNVIQSNGEDIATLSAYLDGKDVTAETVFYLKEGNSKKQLSGNILTVDKVGKYNIIAMYGTFITNDPISVTAIDVAIPAVAEDADVSNTSFVHRAFLNQYTGTGCIFCPGMVYVLRETFEDEVVKSKCVLSAIHSYGVGDPAYITSPTVQSYPYLILDMSKGFTYDMGAEILKEYIKESTSSAAKVGISANPVLTDDVLVVTVEVKAAQAGEYNVGVWFMQDDVFGQQEIWEKFPQSMRTDKTLNYHDNCVRSADSRNSNAFFGFPLGKIEAGKTAQRSFVLNIDKDNWKLSEISDLHFAAFVTEKAGKSYEVVNVIDCPIDQPSPYQYQ